MHPDLRKSPCAGLFQSLLASALFLMPLVSHAQVFFGSGSTSNTATYAPNVALGYGALFSNTTGNFNTAFGYSALYADSTGSYNTAYGYAALYFNNGDYNTAHGDHALFSNTTGGNNTANGFQALLSNTTGYNNTATGGYALNLSTTGSSNSANGYATLFSNTTGNDNTATGNYTLFSNSTGNFNTVYGYLALYKNTTGGNNIALGYGAGYNLTTGSNNIAIGNKGTAGNAGTIRIGTAGTHKATFIAGINGVTVSAGADVFISASGQLGTLTSSRRFKNAIHDMGSVTDKLMQLRPVTFRYKDSAEAGPHPLQYGLIAEEVAKVYPDLVQYDKSGKPFTIYYHRLTPMLLNELQKEHRRNVAMQAAHKATLTEVASLKVELASLKQSQQQQSSAVAKLTALVQASLGKAPQQRVASTQR